MRSIYAKGDYTIIWLGLEANNSNIAFAKMKEVAAYRGARKNREKAGFEITAEIWTWYLEQRIGHDLECWSAISHVVLRFWWLRAWVFQKAIVPSDAIVLWGISFVFWDVAMQTCSLLQEASIEEDKSPEGHMAEVIVKTAVTTLRAYIVTSFWETDRDPNDDNLRLKEILSLLRGFQVSDPRDQVYAALGVSGEEAFMIPDYSLSVRDVYVQLVRAHIESFETSTFLATVRGTKNHRNYHLGYQIRGYPTMVHHSIKGAILTIKDMPALRAEMNSFNSLTPKTLMSFT